MAVVALGVLALVAVTQGATQASQASQASQTAQAAQSSADPVPDCVTQESYKALGFIITEIENGCSTEEQLTIEYNADFGEPPPCFTIAAGETVNHSQRSIVGHEIVGLMRCAPIPDCIVHWTIKPFEGTIYTHLENTCGKTVRVMVEYNYEYGGPSECIVLSGSRPTSYSHPTTDGHEFKQLVPC